MEINVEIDFFEFFKNGIFDYIKIGKTKEWILNNFPNPDGFYNYGGTNLLSDKCSIWKYGAIEFHFDRNELYFIWCDNLPNLKDTSNIKLKKWFLDDLSKLTLSFVLSILNTEQMNYKITFDSDLKNSVIYIEKSNVELWFQSLEEITETPNNYKMIGFGLKK